MKDGLDHRPPQGRGLVGPSLPAEALRPEHRPGPELVDRGRGAARQGGHGPRLHHVETAASVQGPLDVHRRVHRGLDGEPRPGDGEDLVVADARRPAGGGPLGRLPKQELAAPRREGVDPADPGGHAALHDPQGIAAEPHEVRVDAPLGDRLAQARSGLERELAARSGHRVGGEEDPRGPGHHHLLDDHRHRRNEQGGAGARAGFGLAVLTTDLEAVAHRALGEPGGPHEPGRGPGGGQTGHVQDRVELAGVGVAGSVLRCRRGADGEQDPPALEGAAGELPPHGRAAPEQGLGQGDDTEGVCGAAPSVDRALSVAGDQGRAGFRQRGSQRGVGRHRVEGGGGDHVAGWNGKPAAEQRGEGRCLSPEEPALRRPRGRVPEGYEERRRGQKLPSPE